MAGCRRGSGRGGGGRRTAGASFDTPPPFPAPALQRPVARVPAPRPPGHVFGQGLCGCRQADRGHLPRRAAARRSGRPLWPPRHRLPGLRPRGGGGGVQHGAVRAGRRGGGRQPPHVPRLARPPQARVGVGCGAGRSLLCLCLPHTASPPAPARLTPSLAPASPPAPPTHPLPPPALHPTPPPPPSPTPCRLLAALFEALGTQVTHAK